MHQIVVGDVDDREPRFGRHGGDSVDRGGRRASCPDDEVVLLPRESERLGT